VMVAKSGDRLLDASAESAYLERLFPLAALITPNLPEAEVLLARRIRSVDDMKDAATALMRLGCRAVLVKGGHLAGRASDLLLTAESEDWFTAERVDTPHAMRAALEARPWDVILADYALPSFSAPELSAIHKSEHLLPAALMVPVENGLALAGSHGLTLLTLDEISPALAALPPMQEVVSAALPLVASAAGRAQVFRPSDGGRVPCGIENRPPNRSVADRT